MKPVNKEIVLDISDLLPNGEGVAEINARRVQVRNALPREVVRARILKKKKGIKYADAIKVVGPLKIVQILHARAIRDVEDAACCICCPQRKWN